MGVSCPPRTTTTDTATTTDPDAAAVIATTAIKMQLQLRLQTQEIAIHQTFFTVQTGSHATGPRPNACPVTSAVVDIAA